MSNSETVKLTISTLYTPSTLPSEHALISAGKALLSTLDSWKKGKTYGNPKGNTPYSVRTLSRPKGAEDGAAWHARISEHTEGSFENFWDGLGRDKAVKEREFIPELDKVTLLQTPSPTQTLWTLQYKFPPPVSPRVFTVLQVTHLVGGDDGTPREGWIVSVPVDVTEDSNLKGKEEKGVKGRYVSVERIAEEKDGKVEWTMATSSTPGGSIPQFVAERTMPSTISKDVLHFLEWRAKNKAAVSAPTPTLTTTPASPKEPEAAAAPPVAPALTMGTAEPPQQPEAPPASSVAETQPPTASEKPAAMTTKKPQNTESTEPQASVHHDASFEPAAAPAVVAGGDYSSPGE